MSYIFAHRFDDVFMSVCKDARLIVDTHAVSRVGISDSSAHLMWRYCDAVADMVESFGGASVRPAGASEIYKELVEVTDPAYSAPCNDLQANMCLLGAVLFTKLLPTLIGRSLIEALNYGVCASSYVLICIIATLILLNVMAGRLEIAIKSNEMSILLTPYLKERYESRHDVL